MSSYDELARSVIDKGEPDGIPVFYRHGQIVAVHPGNPPFKATLDVLIGGVTHTGIKYADSILSPTVGDEIELNFYGGVYFAVFRAKS